MIKDSHELMKFVSSSLDSQPLAGTKPSGGTKFDNGKPRMDLLVPEAIEITAKVFGFGADKYGDYNWMEGISYSRLFGAIMRHLWAFWRRENDDEESKLNHLGHAMCGIQMMYWMYLNRKDLDDRPGSN